jgi:hypothetical protein
MIAHAGARLGFDLDRVAVEQRYRAAVAALHAGPSATGAPA